MRSRRVALGGALLALALAAPAGARQERPPRVQTQQYLYSHGIDTWHWTISAEETLPALVFTPRHGDKFVLLEADDASRQPVFVHVRQEAGGRGGEDLFDHFCDTSEIVHLVSDEPVEVYVFTGACQNHTTGFATTGTITATFARRL